MVNTCAPLGCWKFQAFHTKKKKIKLKGVTESPILQAYVNDDDKEVRRNYNIPKEQQQKYTCINETLTQKNRKVLKKARDKSRAKKYKYKGFSKNIWYVSA